MRGSPPYQKGAGTIGCSRRTFAAPGRFDNERSGGSVDPRAGPRLEDGVADALGERDVFESVLQTQRWVTAA
jgi:hypothetical protein